MKDKDSVTKAENLFGGEGIKITCEGERHLGAAIGSLEFREKYVMEKVNGWIRDIKQLTSYGKDDPQLAYVAYAKGLCHRWKYVQRTIPEVGHLFEPLEDAIRDILIPAIVGREVSVMIENY